MERESNMKYVLTLNDNVTNRVLKKLGFEIERTKNFTWAVKRASELPKNNNEPRGTILIKLDPPERKIVFRYQADDIHLDLLGELEFMKKFFKVKFR